jgi:hypothetical protein
MSRTKHGRHCSSAPIANGYFGGRYLSTYLENQDRPPIDRQLVTQSQEERRDDMDGATIVRVVSGIACVMILAVLVWRRKKTA